MAKLGQRSARGPRCAAPARAQRLRGMSKKAVVIGCDYRGTVSELHGAVNDAYTHAQILVQFGFIPEVRGERAHGGERSQSSERDARSVEDSTSSTSRKATGVLSDHQTQFGEHILRKIPTISKFRKDQNCAKLKDATRYDYMYFEK